jgi:putative colanic acid biosynthesis acetyltransferase WcaF
MSNAALPFPITPSKSSPRADFAPRKAPVLTPDDSGAYDILLPDDAAIRARQTSPWTLKRNIMRVLWMFAWRLAFRCSFHNWYAWRRFVLRAFGATVGKGVRIRPSAWIEFPWNLTLDDNAIIGDGAILYSLGKIKIGKCTIVSQYSHLCAGTHDHTSRSFDLVCRPISIGEDCWIGTDTFIGPGIYIADRAVVGARSVVINNVDHDQIVAGNPARYIKQRIITH